MIEIAHTETNDPPELRAEKLKDRFLAEYEFINLPDDVKKRLKIDMLASLGYDPDTPITKQSLKVRLIYYMLSAEMNKSDGVLEYYSKHRQKYKKSPVE